MTKGTVRPSRCTKISGASWPASTLASRSLRKLPSTMMKVSTPTAARQVVATLANMYRCRSFMLGLKAGILTSSCPRHFHAHEVHSRKAGHLRRDPRLDHGLAQRRGSAGFPGEADSRVALQETGPH